MAESLISCKQANVKLLRATCFGLSRLVHRGLNADLSELDSLMRFYTFGANITRHSVWVGDNLFMALWLEKQKWPNETLNSIPTPIAGRIMFAGHDALSSAAASVFAFDVLFASKVGERKANGKLSP
jgi:hypothetical protein